MIFHNIFSKKEAEITKSVAKPKIIADVHEKNSFVIPTLHELGCEIVLKPLEIGDFLVGDTIVERKTFSDFIASMINRRLIQQFAQMNQYEKKLLIIEGFDINRTGKEVCARGLNPNAIRGFLLSIMLNHKIPVLITEDSEETALYLAILAKQQLKPKQEISLHSRIPKTPKEQKKYILEAFPNIGPKTAEKLLKKFGTIRDIINASQKEIKAVVGKKSEVFKLVNEKY